MSSRQYLINAAARHQVFIQRYAGSTYKQMAVFIGKALNEAIVLLRSAKTDWSKARYQQMIKDLTAQQQAVYADMAKATTNQMSELAKYEADFTQRMIEQSIAIPTSSQLGFNITSPTLTQLKAAAFTSIIDKVPGVADRGSLTVGDALQEFGNKKAADIVGTVRTGFALGKTTAEISSDIETVMSTIVPRQAYTLARTITNHVAAQSRNEFYKENADIITGYQVVATLDDRTTLTCAALDGKVFPVDDFDQPPYHWNCRTTFIGVVDPQYDVGSDLSGRRPSKGADGAEEVSSKTTYNSWIKSQPASFQDEVLGPDRGALLRAGMSVDKFVDSNYQPINLDELKNKDNQHIFNKAGL